MPNQEQIPVDPSLQEVATAETTAYLEETLRGMHDFCRNCTISTLNNAIHRPERHKAAALSQDLDQWTDPATVVEGTDHPTAKDRFIKMLYAYDRAETNRGVTPEPVIEGQRREKILWDGYWQDVCNLHNAGFKRAPVLAIYNESKTLCDYLAANENSKGAVISLADARVKDPIGRYQQYVADIARLEETFCRRRFINGALIAYAAQGSPTAPEAELKKRLDALDALPDQFAEFDVDERVFVRAAQNPGNNPEAQVRAFIKRRTILSEMLDGHIDEQALAELAINTKYDKPEVLIAYLKELFSGSGNRDRINDLALNSRVSSQEGLLEAALGYAQRKLHDRRKSAPSVQTPDSTETYDSNSPGEGLACRLVSASVGQIATFLEAVVDQQVPTAVNGAAEATAVIDYRIYQLESGIDGTNAPAIGQQIESLRSAQQSLMAAAAILGEGDQSVVEYFRKYMGSIGTIR
ncbi:MAG TPA: hypothetical protein VMR45_02255 [Patescibacteria group bacterium]|nr:hypothetical protein [Patescibacteria group bacterium]